MTRIRDPLPLSATGMNLNADIGVFKTSDGLGWPNLNATLIGCKPYDQELVHRASRDLWLSLALEPLDMSFYLDGKERCSMLAPGLINLTPPDAVLGTRRRNDSLCFHAFLKGEIVAEVAGELFDRDAAGIDFAPAFALESPGMASMMRLLHEALSEPAGHSALKIEYLSRGLAADALARNIAVTRDWREVGARDRLTPRQARRVTDYIREHLSSGLSLNEMAQEAGLGWTLFIQRFKASFGRTPHQYAIEARVRRARELLTAGGMSMAEIATACGFADQAHFSTRFKTATGMTPLAYRQSHG